MISPVSGLPLRLDGPSILTDGRERWPYVDGIAYLRRGRLAEESAALIDSGRLDAARRLMLTDRDRFAPGPPVLPGDLTALFSDTITLRGAMEVLGYGPVGDYFAHRWTSPTYLSGVRLLERTVSTGCPVVEVACGIGHFLRTLQRSGHETVGVDIVYSKLWLARRYLGVTGPLICGDIERSPLLTWLSPPPRGATVFCHDAFYFFEHKRSALRHMRELATTAGRVVVGHVHTRGDAHEAGFAMDLQDYQALTPVPCEGEGKAPDPAAIFWVEGQQNTAPISLRPCTSGLRPNPLLSSDAVNWPSEGWEREYRADCSENDLRPIDEVWQTLLPEQRRAALTGQVSEGDAATFERQRLYLNLPPRW